jgi:UDP-N-acetylglucosamine 2-epimerase
MKIWATDLFKMAAAKNPFGDGKASQRIVQILMNYFGFIDSLPDEFCYKEYT